MAAKENENGVKGFEFRTQIHRTKWETFLNAIYDPSTKQILGRTGKSWGNEVDNFFIIVVLCKNFDKYLR